MYCFRQVDMKKYNMAAIDLFYELINPKQYGCLTVRLSPLKRGFEGRAIRFITWLDP